MIDPLHPSILNNHLNNLNNLNLNLSNLNNNNNNNNNNDKNNNNTLKGKNKSLRLADHRLSFTRRSLNLFLNHSSLNNHLKAALKSPTQPTTPKSATPNNNLSLNSNNHLNINPIAFTCPICNRPISITTHHSPVPCTTCGTLWDSPLDSFINKIPSPTTSDRSDSIREILNHLNQLSFTTDQIERFHQNPTEYLSQLSQDHPAEFDRVQRSHQLTLSLVSDLFSSLSSLSTPFLVDSSTHETGDPSKILSVDLIDSIFQSICTRPGGPQILSSSLHEFLLHPVPQFVSVVSRWDHPSSPTTADPDQYLEWAWAAILLQCPILSSSKVPQQSRLVISARLFGLISFMPNRLHQKLINFFAAAQKRSSQSRVLHQKVELVNVFISDRINYFLQVPHGFGAPSEPLEPLSPSSSQQHQDQMNQLPKYMDDWALLASSRVMTLLFESNLLSRTLPVEEFYNISIDLIQPSDIVYDFEIWESRRSKYYTLCGYPCLLSLSSKINILTYEGKRQMGMEARQALFDSLLRNTLDPPVLVLNVRRSHIVLDSLTQIAQSRNQLKKLIKINFVNEDGVDGGGLKKEWFLLLTRQLVGPEFGMFLHDEEHHQIWFNPASTEFEEFKLIGTILGLAIYNRVTLDIGLPSIVYRKLAGYRVSGLRDLWSLKPEVAKGLKWLLEYQGDDIEEMFQRNFVGEYEAYGTVVEVPLVKGGEKIAVNRGNRARFIELYCDFIMNVSVARQFAAFKEGFDAITSANGFSLFQPTEIELVVVGASYERKLKTADLQSITCYEGFDKADRSVALFWQVVDRFSFDDQKRLLRFITGSDRIPAIGLPGLALKISKAPTDLKKLSHPRPQRLPESHTCFNQLILDQFDDFDTLDSKLRFAIAESEGFSLT